MAPPRVLALIPARSGSKSIPHKNVQPLAGKPLLAHSIEQALACRRIARVLVSTDSEDYAAIARHWGAEVPFLRPAALATDEATDLEVFRHALEWLRDREGWLPEIVVHLRPTYPNRRAADIDAVIERLLDDPTLDAVRTVAPAPATPYKMWTRGTDGLLTPVADLGNEAYNGPRQALPRAYLQNACVDAVRSQVILDGHSMTGRRIHGYVMHEDTDIDDFGDLERAARVAGAAARRRVCVDLVTVLAHADSGPEFAPQQAIAAVNRLHDAGHHVTIQIETDAPEAVERARAWLERRGVRYHDITHARPEGDYVVDGRAVGAGALTRLAAALSGGADGPSPGASNDNGTVDDHD